MFFLRRPSTGDIDRFLTASMTQPLSYTASGIGAAHRYAIDELSGVVGHGERDFGYACDALRGWEQFRLGWLAVLPQDAPADPGTTLAVRIRHMGFWSLNGARVVSREEWPGRRFAVAYGTLTNHAEQGEELFEVSLDAGTGDVTYRIRAISRPRARLAQVGAPIVRWFQARARVDSLHAMRRAVAHRIAQR
jgi:uncharacterized protein (UPF0548 family)